MSDDELASQIDALRAMVLARKAPKPKKVAVREAEEEVIYEEPARPKPAPRPKKAPAPKGVELRPAPAPTRAEPRMPVRATHRCNCPDCPHKS